MGSINLARMKMLRDLAPGEDHQNFIPKSEGTRRSLQRLLDSAPRWPICVRVQWFKFKLASTVTFLLRTCPQKRVVAIRMLAGA